MQAIIFTEGFESSNKSLLPESSKSMLLVGDKNLLSHQIELLKRNDISEIVVLHPSKFSGALLIDDNTTKNTQIIFHPTDNYNTLTCIPEFIDKINGDVIVLSGCQFMHLNLRKLLLFHYAQLNRCTIGLKPSDNPKLLNLFEIDEQQKVIKIDRPPHTNDFYKNLTSFNLFVSNKDTLSTIAATKTNRAFFDNLIEKKQLCGYVTSEYTKPISNERDIARIEKDLEEGKACARNYQLKQKAIFLDRDGVINVERSYIQSPDEFELYPETTRAVKQINQSGFHALVVTNQAIIARNMCSIDDLNTVHKKLDTELGNAGAYIDNLYYCPHHPDKSISEGRDEYKIDCNCRKPKPGLLLQAAEDYNIDLEKSYMIGDTERDIIAGKSAGCTTIGVMTGYGLKNATILPDYFFTHIGEAVSFIVNEPFKWVYQELEKRKKRIPEVILIGGSAFSGKSTLTRYLKQKYTQANKRVCTIDLDNWLRPTTERVQSKTVFDRFYTTQIVSEIQQILAGIEVRKTTFSKHPDRKPIDTLYAYKGEDVIIIEGTVALNFDELKALSTKRLYVSCSKENLYARFRNYYLWCGKSEGEIKVLFEKREQDEHSIIEKVKESADLIVDSSSV